MKWSRIRHGMRLLRWRELALRFGACPFCGPTLFVRLSRDGAGIRCMRCAAGLMHLTIGRTLIDQVPALDQCDVCELSARGPFVAFLDRAARSVSTSEYVEDASPGESRAGIRCEDVQRLSYDDASFDVCTSTEVMEHVPDDAAAFAELHRVLRPGGLLLFTVPLHGGATTVERARLTERGVEYRLPPVYHADPMRPDAGILAFRDYGRDILERLRAAGFVSAELLVESRLPWTSPREVVMARKAPA